MSKIKKQNKLARMQRRREEALKAQGNVRGYEPALVEKLSVKPAVSASATDIMNNKFALPLEQIKQDLVKTEIFVVLAIAAIIWLQKTQFLLDKVSLLVKF